METTKKLVLFSAFFIALIVLFSIFASAQDDILDDVLGENEDIIVSGNEIAGEIAQKNLAFTWLSEKVDSEGWPKTAEENAFALLALTSDSDLRTDGKRELIAKKTGDAWSNVENTALAMIALNNIGNDVDDIEEWLLGQTQPYKATNLEWRMQLDYTGTTSCEVSYGGKVDNVDITEDRKLELNKGVTTAAPKCLSVTDDGFWLKINPTVDSGACLEKIYSINCDDSIKASIFYKQKNTLFIPSKTESGSYVDLKIESMCLADKGGCDYGANLWAAYALSEIGSSDVNVLLPYLISQQDVESDYMPYAFLYMMTENDEYVAGLLNQQEAKGYWYTKKYGKWYATALSFMALKDYYGAQQNLTKAKLYILDHQSNDGHWENSLRDTAFLFYAMWPSYYAGMGEEENLCTESNYLCKTICDSEDEVEVKEYSYFCDEKECCKKKESSLYCTVTDDCMDPDCSRYTLSDGCTCEYKIERSCDDECDNDGDGLVDNDDLDCQISECAANNYDCCVDCRWGHKEQYDSSCGISKKCCEECSGEMEICDDNVDNDDDGLTDCEDNDCDYNEKCRKTSLLWFIIPGLIIILAAVYFYFNKTKGFNILNYFKKKPSQQQQQRRFPMQAMQQAQQQTQAARAAPRFSGAATRRVVRPVRRTETETELEKTMRKIKEMGKK